VLVGAILMVGPNASAGGRDSGFSDSHESLGGDPIASIEVLGQSLLERSISRLQRDGIRDIAVLADRSLSTLIRSQLTRNTDTVLVNSPANLWSAAQRKFDECVERGVDLIVLMRLGAYVEFDLGQLLQFHHEQGQQITPVYDGRGPLDYWVLNTSWGEGSTECVGAKIGDASNGSPFRTGGYVNRLVDARDLRHLVVDSFLGRCEIRPNGVQLKPGIWVDEGAQVHRRARIVAPAYIGRGVKVRSDALITRCSSLERGCEVGYGTVVEDASVLVDTCLGTGLDVTHAVVCGRNLLNLRHGAALEINDPKLLSRRTDVHRQFLYPDVRSQAQPSEPAAANINEDASELRAAIHDAKPALIPSRRNAWAD
jgi:NDP-sugar pyrophosphorylase family protein